MRAQLTFVHICWAAAKAATAAVTELQKSKYECGIVRITLADILKQQRANSLFMYVGHVCIYALIGDLCSACFILYHGFVHGDILRSRRDHIYW